MSLPNSTVFNTSTQIPDANSSTTVPIFESGLVFDFVYQQMEDINFWPLIIIATYSASGTIGNSIVIYVYLFKWKKNKTRVFILCLAVLDFFNCVINMPFEIAVLLRPLDFNNHYLCKISRGCTYVINNTGALVFVSVAIERYLLVYYPLKSRQMTPKYAKLMCLISFIISSSVSWPSFVFYGSRTLSIPVPGAFVRGKTCLIADEYEIDKGLPLVFTAVLLSLLLIVFTILITLYIAIGRKIYIVTCTDMEESNSKQSTTKLFGKSIISAITGVSRPSESNRGDFRRYSKATCDRKATYTKYESESATDTSINASLKRFSTSSPTTRRKSRESRRFSSYKGQATRKNTVMMRMVTIAFMLSFTPFLIILVIRYTNPYYYYGLNKNEKIVYQVFLRTYFINSMVNPFIYGFMNLHFRKHVKDMFRSTCCRSRGSQV